MLEFKKVTKHFGDIEALNDISFAIKDGEFVVLTGPSGSGKTTILKLLIREFPPTSGEIIFNDTKVHSLKKKAIPRHRRKIGAIFQDYKLLSERTIKENIEIALAIVGVPKKERTDRVEKVINMVGLSERAHLFPSQLSGGELQRAAIARAFVVNPDLIFADEPTGNLDKKTAESIMSLLKKINETGKIVIVATHDIDLLAKGGFRIIKLEKGKLVSDTKGKDKS